MSSIHVLLLCGGGSAEHEVSLVSANYIEQQLKQIDDITYTRLEMNTDGWFDEQGQLYHLTLDRTLHQGEQQQTVDYVIPCVHGFPGETGDLQSFLDMAKLPYLGCGAEASTNCFNKITTKLWFDALGIPNTPYVFLSENCEESHLEAANAFDKWGKVFVKAASQGSSVGCYRVTEKEALAEAVNAAFGYSEQVLIEKAIKPRELEISSYEYNGELIITKPGEVSCPDDQFYTYEEKYSADSHSTTAVEAINLTEAQIEDIREYARKAFIHMKLKDLSRIDFFLSENGEILLNEINTFPGMTPISMFPKMLENHGHTFKGFLEQAIMNAVR
ncbi:D-alanine--D-alanine ligase [Photobacterium sp. DNB23_23_1]|uniref:D-alanine--D-alanine ligase n=1 Tax=Photobacterium pectinilyticum TaxID=2906793 RepID=A0ABT1MYN3_9GAMM|nr:D-alanine--D-alanine ligase [Photobacterium sp. ZSDE20]MCQ1056937.1 D-alanine--D-alanine ligase [Photobacterium sp. ZSDE20]MDD1821072.1 D-alanine--D-alanine ligase [Photobacterium sp. ZSDE20]